MRFVVSQEFRRHDDIRKMGERYFALMPLWVQDALIGNPVVVIAYSSQGIEKTLRQEKIERSKNTFTLVFRGKIASGYQDFFGWVLKQVIHNNQVLESLFIGHARRIMVPGISNDDVVETLFRHLAWYFIAPGSLRGYNQERFDLCKEIADDLLSVGLPQGTLQ